MGYREEPDGTRVYDHGKRYRPLALEDRKYRKFPKGTQWHGGKPFGPLPLLPMDEREMPGTVPDEDAAQHTIGCLCPYCKVERVRRMKRRRYRIKLARDDRPIPESPAPDAR